MEPAVTQALTKIAESVQSHFWPQTLVEWAQLALVLLTGLTLVYLIKYTQETSQLRIAARDQVEVSNQLLRAAQDQNSVNQRLLQEAQVQNETALRPILAFALQETLTHDETGRAIAEGRKLHLKNLGNGPALNVTVEYLEGDGETRFVFHHPDTLARGEDSVVYIGDFVSKGKPLMIPWDALEEVVFGAKAIPLPQMLTIQYRSAAGKLYETVQRLDLTAANTTLTLEFDRCGPLDLSRSSH